MIMYLSTVRPSIRPSDPKYTFANWNTAASLNITAPKIVSCIYPALLHYHLVLTCPVSGVCMYRVPYFSAPHYNASIGE